MNQHSENNLHPIDQLKYISQVDAPDFLLTRINQKIENYKQSHFSKPLSIFLGLSFSLVLLFNISLITKNTATKLTSNSFASSMQLVNNNSLYHE